jgi:serine phosphatase RsbU (regulator of sigma subunit)
MVLIFNYISSFRKTTIIGISVILLLLIGYLDFVTGIEVSISIFYLLPVALCSWFINKWAGFIIAIFSSVALYVADYLLSHSVSHLIIPYWNAIVMLGFFLLIAYIISALKDSLDKENVLALNIQKSLLPKRLPEIHGYKIAATWIPTRVVSGDHYDIITVNKNLYGICIADASGHGVPAALLMSNLQSAFRIITASTVSPKDVCTQLNKFYAENMEQGKFISFFFGILDIEKKTFVYSNAGHPPALVIRQNQVVISLESGGLLLGIDSRSEYQEGKVELNSGDVILLYTDGIIEAKNSKGELFGEEQLINTCRTVLKSPAFNISQEILTSVSKFSNGKNDDDITLFVISID